MKLMIHPLQIQVCTQTSVFDAETEMHNKNLSDCFSSSNLNIHRNILQGRI